MSWLTSKFKKAELGDYITLGSIILILIATVYGSYTSIQRNKKKITKNKKSIKRNSDQIQQLKKSGEVTKQAYKDILRRLKRQEKKIDLLIKRQMNDKKGE